MRSGIASPVKRTAKNYPAHEAPPPAPPEGKTVSDFTLHPGEELWVIERRTTFAAPPQDNDDFPGCGSLMTRRPGDDGPAAGERHPDDDRDARTSRTERSVPIPLKHTAVDARIDGYISTVRVTQQFENPFSEKIEALYVFPLPENAAVSDFVMTVGDRHIRGVIRERAEAEQIYNDARRQGYTASLLTQERPNIFTQHVANIEPGRQIDVDITYFSSLAYRDGWFEWVFPMVVGPRFNPPCTTDGVGAVERGAYGYSGQKTEVQYLRPHDRSGHDISINLAINAGVPIESIQCSSHQVHVRSERDRGCPQLAQVELSSLDTIPNKDMVVRYRVAGDRVKSAMLSQVTPQGGFFTLMLVPPADLKYCDRGPMEMVFVVDRSGSMDGEPLAQAKRAVEHALRNLDQDDTFQVIDFSDSSSTLGSRPLAAKWENIRRGIDYVNSLHAGGGTMMLNGIKAALDFPRDDRRQRFVCFLTDGYIGNEGDILDQIKRRLGETRIFSFGMGSSPNRYLLEEMARQGRGIAAYVSLKDDSAPIMDMFLQRVSHAALTRLDIDFGGMDVSDVYPKRLPDLYVGGPVIITGRFKGAGATTVRVTGRAGRNGDRIPLLIPVNLGEDEGARRGSLASVWARQRIADLSARSPADQGKAYASEITRTALDFGLMSAFTSFIAVDSLTRTDPHYGTTMEVPVPTPEGVNYETTVKERSQYPITRRPGEDGKP
jgi:Ca-activated chloride channel family protein